ncbi:MAG: hypothetical protein OXT67_01875 [Zetaproteobacteria bacterium]|nr:hypothetical protein [Zetaproteobacteria bacterium]
MITGIWAPQAYRQVLHLVLIQTLYGCAAISILSCKTNSVILPTTQKQSETAHASSSKHTIEISYEECQKNACQPALFKQVLLEVSPSPTVPQRPYLQLPQKTTLLLVNHNYHLGVLTSELRLWSQVSQTYLNNHCWGFFFDGSTKQMVLSDNQDEFKHKILEAPLDPIMAGWICTREDGTAFQAHSFGNQSSANYLEKWLAINSAPPQSLALRPSAPQVSTHVRSEMSVPTTRNFDFDYIQQLPHKSSVPKATGHRLKRELSQTAGGAGEFKSIRDEDLIDMLRAYTLAGRGRNIPVEEEIAGRIQWRKQSREEILGEYGELSDTGVTEAFKAFQKLHPEMKKIDFVDSDLPGLATKLAQTKKAQVAALIRPELNSAHRTLVFIDYDKKVILTADSVGWFDAAQAIRKSNLFEEGYSYFQIGASRDTSELAYRQSTGYECAYFCLMDTRAIYRDNLTDRYARGEMGASSPYPQQGPYKVVDTFPASMFLTTQSVSKLTFHHAMGEALGKMRRQGLSLEAIKRSFTKQFITPTQQRLQKANGKEREKISTELRLYKSYLGRMDEIVGDETRFDLYFRLENGLLPAAAAKTGGRGKINTTIADFRIEIFNQILQESRTLR